MSEILPQAVVWMQLRKRKGRKDSKVLQAVGDPRMFGYKLSKIWTSGASMRRIVVSTRKLEGELVVRSELRSNKVVGQMSCE